MQTVCSVHNLYFKRGRDFILKVPSLEVKEGIATALIGQSGCGKSTLLECIALMHESATFKDFYLKGTDVLSLTKAQKDIFVQKKMGFMPQTNGLLPFLSVFDNLKVQIDVSCKSFSRDKRQSLLDDALFMVKTLGISDCINKKPHEMSIGQRQRASFVRSVAHRPYLVLIDEPTSALDPMHAKDIFSIIFDICKNYNLASLVVTHDQKGVFEQNYDIYAYKMVNGINSFFHEGDSNVI